MSEIDYSEIVEGKDGHIFETGLTKDKFEAVVRRSCRSAFDICLDAANPTVIPQVRLFRVDFDSVEDRDRVRIAMRFVEKEMAAAEAKATAKPTRRP